MATHIYFIFYKIIHSTRFYLVICKMNENWPISFKIICNFININIEPSEILQWWVCGATNGLDASHMFYVSYSNLLGKRQGSKHFLMYLLELNKSPLVTIVSTKVCILGTIRLGVLKHWDSPSPVFVIRVGQWMFCNPCQSSRDLTPHQHATNLIEKVEAVPSGVWRTHVN